MPPIEYGTGPGQVAMDNTNAQPGLAVWLLLVTNPNFLLALNNPAQHPGLISVQQIAAATNLTPACVQSIMDYYATNQNGAQRQAFMEVSSVFQNFAQAAGYPPTYCPTSIAPILSLATSGAAIAAPAAVAQVKL